jgi:hypothetical protein
LGWIALAARAFLLIAAHQGADGRFDFLFGCSAWNA